MPLCNVQVYTQGELISSDIVDETEVQLMTGHLEQYGYEVRSEAAWESGEFISAFPGPIPHPSQPEAPQENQELVK